LLLPTMKSAEAVVPEFEFWLTICEYVLTLVWKDARMFVSVNVKLPTTVDTPWKSEPFQIKVAEAPEGIDTPVVADPLTIVLYPPVVWLMTR